MDEDYLSSRGMRHLCILSALITKRTFRYKVDIVVEATIMFNACSLEDYMQYSTCYNLINFYSI